MNFKKRPLSDLKESFFDGAYMVRDDGAEFKVPFHVYVDSPIDIYDLYDYGEWIYNSMKSAQLKKDLIDCLWFGALCEGTTPDVMFDTSNDFNSFVTSSNFKSTVCNSEHNEITKKEYNTITDDIASYINEHFLRVRTGGKIDRDNSRGESWFRVSSHGVDWFDVIYMFVYKHHEVKYITICHDEESYGDEDIYSHKGNKFDLMPREEFLSLSGTPVVEEYQDVCENTNTQMNKALFGDVSGKIRTFGIMTSENPQSKQLSHEENNKLLKSFKDSLSRGNVHYTKIIGSFGNKEHSFMLYNITRSFMKRMSKLYNQESFIFGYQTKDDENSKISVVIEYWEFRHGEYVLVEESDRIDNASDFDDYFSRYHNNKFSIYFKYFNEAYDELPDIVDEQECNISLDDSYTSKRRWLARSKMTKKVN